MSVQTVFLPGLSPLARGTQRGLMSALNHHRFIPAGAGNTMLPSFTPFLISVYPRWRGEHNRPYEDHWHGGGLSPLARGTHPEINGDGAFTRFIPAGAGNTSNCCNGQRSHAVYPRWRGEHCLGGGSAQPRNGLSPLARGTRGNSFLDAALLRFIPAGAGNTVDGFSIFPPSAVYPRWRGEHSIANMLRLMKSGLSPLARGTLTKSAPGPGYCRFIPAGAGNTVAGR